jgi:hypothetical protein
VADEISPDGLIRVEWQFSTGLMSHEINSPRFIDARTGEPFLTLWDEQWDGSVRWQGEGRFGLALRNYGRPGNVEAEVDLPARTWRSISPAGEIEPLIDIDRSIRAAFARAAAEAQRAAPALKPPGLSLRDVLGYGVVAAVAGGAWYFFRR